MYGRSPQYVRLDIRPLNGGLRAAGVARVWSRMACAAGAPRSFVVKRANGTDCRELAAYQALGRARQGIAPRLLGFERTGPDEVYLYLEWIDTWREWPWAEPEVAGMVLERLAHLHETLPEDSFVPALAGWNYEALLSRSAETTLELFEASSRHPNLAGVRRSLAPLRRMVRALPEVRSQLLSALPGTALLHGDVHTGNTIMTMRADTPEPVLLDWARVRRGSPLEDVGSWLQSLGYWEPEARRRHDSLLGRYLAARGFASPPSRTLRDAYWLAGVSNAMAGALRYHIYMAASDEASDCERYQAARQAGDWLRIVRRADAIWRA
jgi:hypothetical protein